MRTLQGSRIARSYVPHFSLRRSVHALPGSAGVAVGRQLELNNPRVDRSVRDQQFGYGDGQLEPARPGTAGVHIEDAVAPLDQRLVGMPRYDDLEPGGDWIEVELRQIMQHVDEDIADL